MYQRLHKLVHLEQALPTTSAPDTAQVVHATYTCLFNAQQEVAYLMLASMFPKL